MSLEVSFQIYHYWRSQCAMKAVSLEVNFQICHYWRSWCAMEGVGLEVNFQIYHYWRDKRAMKEVNMKENLRMELLDERTVFWFKAAPRHSLTDVSGMHELKEQLRECIANAKLKQPEMKKLHSYFFLGPPDCGMSYIIEAFVHELMMNKNYTYLSVTGSDLLSRYVGETEKNIARLFENAEKHAPCIVFIDDMDSVCNNRSLPTLSENALSITVAFLIGYHRIKSSGKEIIFIGSTNHPNQVDNAMFERKMLVPLPDQETRKQLFSRRLKEIIRLEDGFSFDDMAMLTEKYNYGEIVCMVDRLKKEILKRVTREYHDEQEAIEAVKSGDFRLTRELFESVQVIDRVKLVRVPLPDQEARKQAFSRRLKGVIRLEEGFSFGDMAMRTERYDYRDIDHMVSRLEEEIKKRAIYKYNDEQEVSEALKSGDFCLTRELFESVRADFLPAPKDEIEKELDEWEQRFAKQIK